MITWYTKQTISTEFFQVQINNCYQLKSINLKFVEVNYYIFLLDNKNVLYKLIFFISEIAYYFI